MRAFLWVILFLAVSGCKSGPGANELTGSWKQEVPKGQKVITELIFTSEGRFRTYTGALGEARRIAVFGKYKYDEKTGRLESDPRDAFFEGWPASQQEGMKKKMLKQLLSPDAGTVEWVDKNKFRWIPDKPKDPKKKPDPPVTYTRTQPLKD